LATNIVESEPTATLVWLNVIVTLCPERRHEAVRAELQAGQLRAGRTDVRRLDEDLRAEAGEAERQEEVPMAIDGIGMGRHGLERLRRSAQAGESARDREQRRSQAGLHGKRSRDGQWVNGADAGVVAPWQHASRSSGPRTVVSLATCRSLQNGSDSPT
jgi:hypothetical protein